MFQQQASVSQGQICSDKCTSCHGRSCRSNFLHHPVTVYWHCPTSPSADPIMPGTWQGSPYSANLEVTGMTWPGKIPMAQAEIKPQIYHSRGGRLRRRERVVGLGRGTLISDQWDKQFNQVSISQFHVSSCIAVFPGNVEDPHWWDRQVGQLCITREPLGAAAAGGAARHGGRQHAAHAAWPTEKETPWPGQVGGHTWICIVCRVLSFCLCLQLKGKLDEVTRWLEHETFSQNTLVSLSSFCSLSRWKM